MFKSSMLCICHCLPEYECSLLWSNWWETAKTKPPRIQNGCLGYILSFYSPLQNLKKRCHSADSIYLYILGNWKYLMHSPVLEILTLSQLFLFNSGSGSIWPFMFPDMSEWITLWFPFLRQTKSIFSSSTLFFLSPGLNQTTVTVDVSVIIIFSSVTRLCCKDLRPTITKAREGSGSIINTHLCNWVRWRGGSDNWCSFCVCT